MIKVFQLHSSFTQVYSTNILYTVFHTWKIDNTKKKKVSVTPRSPPKTLPTLPTPPTTLPRPPTSLIELEKKSP